MNKCHFLGRLTRDPELKELSGGKKVVNFTIAVGRDYKKNGETVKEVAYIDCEIWDTGADVIAKHFVKGNPIIVHCSVKQDNWEDKDSGQKRSKLKFRVDSFDFVPGNSNKGEGSVTQDTATTTTSTSEPVGDDIPF